MIPELPRRPSGNDFELMSWAVLGDIETLKGVEEALALPHNHMRDLPDQLELLMTLDSIT